MSAHPDVQGDTHVGVQIRRTSFEGATKTARFLNTTLVQNIDSGGPSRGVPDLPLNEPAVAIECGRCKLAGTCRALFLKNPRSVRGPSCYTRNITYRFLETDEASKRNPRESRAGGGVAKMLSPCTVGASLAGARPALKKSVLGTRTHVARGARPQIQPACLPSGTHTHTPAPTRACRGEDVCASRSSIVLARKQKAFGLTEGTSSRTRPEASARSESYVVRRTAAIVRGRAPGNLYN